MKYSISFKNFKIFKMYIELQICNYNTMNINVGAQLYLLLNGQKFEQEFNFESLNKKNIITESLLLFKEKSEILIVSEIYQIFQIRLQRWKVY